MTSWSLLPLALVLLCSSSLCTLGCDLTQDLQEDFSLLNQMSTFPPVPCWKDRTRFNFPIEAMEGSQLKRGNATVIIHEMLQQIFTVFSLKAVPAAWNQTQLIQLFIGLDQQLQQLEKCLGKDGKWEQPFLENDNLRLTLRNYFQGISQYLQGREYSHCAWEIVRIEIRRVFLFMSKLTRKLRN
ncbi:interferon alpha-1-like [Macrotis lagotis]|uniref:interferon alpha-1-like n=1 Tax=Macrotis lagotis TaxID=92651 RepID=UPI003D689E68